MRAHKSWYEIPDLVTALATFCFFCLGIAYEIDDSYMPSDDERAEHIKCIKQDLLNWSFSSATFAVVISCYRAADESISWVKALPDNNGIIIFSAVFIYILWKLFLIFRSHITYIGE